MPPPPARDGSLKVTLMDRVECKRESFELAMGLVEETTTVLRRPHAAHDGCGRASNGLATRGPPPRTLPDDVGDTLRVLSRRQATRKTEGGAAVWRDARPAGPGRQLERGRGPLASARCAVLGLNAVCPQTILCKPQNER